MVVVEITLNELLYLAIISDDQFELQFHDLKAELELITPLKSCQMNIFKVAAVSNTCSVFLFLFILCLC